MDMALPIYIDLSWFVRICLAAYRVKSYQLLKSLQEPWHALKPVILAMQVPIYLSLPKGFWALRAGETNIRSYILIYYPFSKRGTVDFLLPCTFNKQAENGGAQKNEEIW